MTLTDWIVLMLLIAPILPVTASAIFVRHTPWRTSSPSLMERALIAGRDALVALLAAGMALNRILMWDWPPPVVVMLLGFALLLVSLPSAWWLALYFRGAFRR